MITFYTLPYSIPAIEIINTLEDIKENDYSFNKNIKLKIFDLRDEYYLNKYKPNPSVYSYVDGYNISIIDKTDKVMKFNERIYYLLPYILLTLKDDDYNVIILPYNIHSHDAVLRNIEMMNSLVKVHRFYVATITYEIVNEFYKDTDLSIYKEFEKNNHIYRTRDLELLPRNYKKFTDNLENIVDSIYGIDTLVLLKNKITFLALEPLALIYGLEASYILRDAITEDFKRKVEI